MNVPIAQSGPDVTSQAPLKPATFMVLLVLNGGAKHGYGIKKEVRARSDGAIDLDPGGLYRLIARLETLGLIERSDAPASQEDGDERRNYYQITTGGRRVVAGEARRMARLVGLPEVAALAEAAE